LLCGGWVDVDPDAAPQLWEPSWEDEDSNQDFAAKLREELDKRMKD
jgi:hypothetical protein